MIIQSITELIYNTPLLALKKVLPSPHHIYGKMEYVQPGGSIKDRPAFYILQKAKAEGLLKEGQLVVEMSSGNMAAGLAVVCLALGHPFTVVMSEGNSPERLRILKALGAHIVLVPQVDGELGKVTGKDLARAEEEAKRIALEQGGYYVDQFYNDFGVEAHFNTTGPALWQDLEGKVDVFIATIGSSGTFTGTANYLKSKNQNVVCIAVEPESAAILKTGQVQNPKHIIQGNGYGYVPDHWEVGLADQIITVSDAEVYEMTKALSQKEGAYVGFSSGANLAACKRYLEQNPTDKPLNIVIVLCDTAYKYSNL